jgi:hypothetical protein
MYTLYTHHDRNVSRFRLKLAGFHKILEEISEGFQQPFFDINVYLLVWIIPREKSYYRITFLN